MEKCRWIKRCEYLIVLTLLLPVLSGPAAPAADSAVVLMYHRFGEDRYPSTSVRTDQFKAQLELLSRDGHTVLPLSGLLAALREGKRLPPKSVVITVDDAYRSIYTVAYPMLREYGFPFTVFVSTDPVDNGSPDYMTWDQMREMARGGASFANHGAGHLSVIAEFEGETEDDRIGRAVADVEKCRKRLSAEVEPVPGVFAYPYGEFDGRIADVLRGMGYICFGQHSGAVGTGSDRRALPRFAIAEAYSDIDEFRVKVMSLPMPVEACIPWEPVVDVRRPVIDVTLGETDARLDELACFVGGQGRVPVRWIEPGKRFQVSPKNPLAPGRNRVNCTVPRSDGRYFWFSHPWFLTASGP